MNNYYFVVDKFTGKFYSGDSLVWREEKCLIFTNIEDVKKIMWEFRFSDPPIELVECQIKNEQMD